MDISAEVRRDNNYSYIRRINNPVTQRVDEYHVLACYQPLQNKPAPWLTRISRRGGSRLAGEKRGTEPCGR
jgi:hypothetical protein